jgi:maltooligosyltrehalose trehalohydrolase
MEILQMGAQYLGHKKCRFSVWAPLANEISLHLDSQKIPLKKQKNDVFSTVVHNVLPGALYYYSINGENTFPDPCSHYQPKDVFGPSAVVDHSSFAWRDSAWKGSTLEQMIIYELHIGTFTKQGTFSAAQAKIPYLKELGITAVEIMPIAQFPGKYNWGYDGVFPYAVESSYGTPENFRNFVQECHLNGIQVMLDVVYNHLGPEGNCIFWNL